jgi:subtilisin family serine protease
MHILDLANAYHNLAAVRYAHPEFGIKPVLFDYRIFDRYSQYQWHLKKVVGDFNNVTVWDFAGLDSAITVAVIDDGIAEHEDLPAARISPGYDFAGSKPFPLPGQLFAHGMGCAGIIAASHTTDSILGLQTNTGVFSLNPKALIKPVRIFDDHGFCWLGSDQIAEAITYAWRFGADIISCSWGYVDPDDEPTVVADAINDAYTLGRNGLGCPVIYASGNGAISYPRKVSFPARYSKCLAVGAIDITDTRWDYSQYGNDLDLVAPSGETNLLGDVWTLDQMGADGFNPNVVHGGQIVWDCPTVEENDINYDCRFGGTSAACPVASGVASLLLAKRSNLRVEIIYEILRNSAVRDLASGTITPPDTAYGYGRVDAFRAMLAISRGDANNDNRFTSGDAVAIMSYLFRNGPTPKPVLATGDANCDGHINSGDAVYIINYIFRFGPPPQICYKYDY